MSDSDDIYGRPQGMGAKIRNVLVGVLVGMLVLAFAVWGIEDVFSPNSSGAIVKVGEKEVGQAEFQERFNDMMRDFAETNGEGLTNQQAYDRGMPQQLVQQLTRDLAIEADAEDLGVDVNNRDVAKYINEIEAFKNPITGEFDEDSYRRLLASNRITEREFENDVVNQLTQRQTLPAVMGGIQAPSDYAKRYNTFVNEIRTGRVLRLDESVLSDIPEPTEAEIASYVAANRERFTSPEYRQALLIRLEPVDFALDVSGLGADDVRLNEEDERYKGTISEEDVRKRFDTLVSAGEIGSVETRDVTLVSATSEAQAASIASRIAGGETAAAIAAEMGLPAPDTFEAIRPDTLFNPASDTAAFELEQGEAKAVATELGGFEVVVVDAINAGEVPDFDAERDRLRRDLVLGEARRNISAFEKIFDDALLNGRSIEEIAQNNDVPLQSLPMLDRNGVTPDGIRMEGTNAIPGIARDQALLNALFTADIGYESDIIPTSSGGLAVLRVIDTIEPEPQSIDDVRDQVVAELRADAVEAALIERGREIEGRLRAGEDIGSVASELGLEVEDLLIQRANPPRQFSSAVLVGMLDGKVGDTARGRGVATGTYEVGVLDKISSGTERLGGRLLDTIREQVSEQIALDISTSYQNAILADEEYTVFEDQLRSVLSLNDDS